MLPGTKRSRLTTRASVHLDMIRGAAALAVLVGHVRGLFFTAYHELPHRNPALAALYALTGLGHQAVIVFFVLSGFFIILSILETFDRHQWSWKVYFVNRIVRLSLVLAPALVLTWLVDRLGIALTASTSLYHSTLAYYFASTPASLGTLRNFVGNFFYLQGILVRPFGSNGPLWSLSYEFWYYLLFPIALFAWLKRIRPAISIACLLLAVFIAWFIGEIMALYFLLWLLGGAIARSFLQQKSALRFPYAAALSAIPFAATLALSVKHPLDSAFQTDSVVAFGFGVWLFALVRSPEGPVAKSYARAARLFAGCSYTLYATHFPLLFFFRARFIGNNVWSPDWPHLLFGVGIAVITTAIGWGLAQLTEARTASARRVVMSLLSRAARPAAPNP